MNKKLCEICSQNEHKYKCPKCRIIYCSLNCYKVHKESCLPATDINKNNDVKQEIKSEDLNSEITKEENMLEVDNKNIDISQQCTSSSLVIPSVKENSTITYTSEDVVSIDKLQLLDNSDELKHILKNKHLKNLLQQINNTNENDIDGIMDKAMHEPLFTEFAEVCLKLVQDNKDLELPLPNDNKIDFYF